MNHAVINFDIFDTLTLLLYPEVFGITEKMILLHFQADSFTWIRGIVVKNLIFSLSTSLKVFIIHLNRMYYKRRERCQVYIFISLSSVYTIVCINVL